MQHYKIIIGFHKLYVGGNGKITNGVTGAIIPESRYFGHRAYSQVSDTNGCTFRKYPAEMKDNFGLSDEEYNNYLKQLTELEESQKHERKT